MRMKSLLTKGLIALGMAGGAFATAAVVHSQSRSRVTPYLEVQQVLNADLNDGDVLTYTSIGAGIDGHIQSRRVQATISYNYQRRIAWEGDLNDDDVHSGLAAAQFKVAPGVTFDAGALAVRSHGDLAVPVAGVRTSDDPNLVDVYSVYAGPTVSTRVGPIDVGASYRLGYVHIDDDSLAGGPPGAPRFDSYDHSLVQSAAVSAGAGPGEMAPFGWTLGAGYSREDSDRLDATNEGLFVRGDVVLPVSHSVAVTGGVGYEEFSASQQDYLRNAAGLPVLTPNGELIGDPSRPRLLSFDQSGLIWDVGVIWRPSRRTELQARVGRRYGGTTYTGSLEHRINENYAVTASVYDSVTTFGQLLILNLDNVPVSFKQARNGLGGGVGGIGGCVFGSDPTTGSCFDDALQSINGATFRNRGANVMLSGGRGPWSFNAGAGYVQRRYFGPPATGAIFSRDNITDRSFTLQAGASRALSRRSGVSGDVYAGWFDSGAAGADTSFSSGVTGSYYRTLMDGRLEANVAAGLYNTQAGEFDSTLASILFGMRYRF